MDERELKAIEQLGLTTETKVKIDYETFVAFNKDTKAYQDKEVSMSNGYITVSLNKFAEWLIYNDTMDKKVNEIISWDIKKRKEQFAKVDRTTFFKVQVYFKLETTYTNSCIPFCADTYPSLKVLAIHTIDFKVNKKTKIGITRDLFLIDKNTYEKRKKLH